MVKTYVAFDTRSGRILGVHHGAKNAKMVLSAARSQTRSPQSHAAEPRNENIEVIKVSFDAVEPGEQYKVDVKSRALVATEGRDGVGFGFGAIGSSSLSPDSKY